MLYVEETSCCSVDQIMLLSTSQGTSDEEKEKKEEKEIGMDLVKKLMKKDRADYTESQVPECGEA